MFGLLILSLESSYLNQEHIRLIEILHVGVRLCDIVHKLARNLLESIVCTYLRSLAYLLNRLHQHARAELPNRLLTCTSELNDTVWDILGSYRSRVSCNECVSSEPIVSLYYS